MAKQKKLLVKIIAALLLFVAAIFCDDLKIVQAALFLLSYFLVGWPILQKAVKNLFYGQVFDENFFDGDSDGWGFCLRRIFRRRRSYAFLPDWGVFSKLRR